MTEAVKQKVSIIINGDTKSSSKTEHQENVNLSVKALEKEGYKTIVFSPDRPRDCDIYTNDYESLKSEISSLQSALTDQDELVIYVTGHGDQKERKQGICIDGDCYTNIIAQTLDGLNTYGHRTVIMDQCFGGGFKDMFLDDPRTEFISAGSPDEVDYCQSYTPYFWADDPGMDLSGEGSISFLERHIYASQHSLSKTPAKPQYLDTWDNPIKEKPFFPTEITNVESKENLQERINDLKPGQVAIIEFGAPWCPPCKVFSPEFEAMAKEAMGKYLFLKVDDKSEIAGAYGCLNYPSVLIVDGSKNKITLVGLDEVRTIKEKIKTLGLPPEERMDELIASALDPNNTNWRETARHALDFAKEINQDDIAPGKKEEWLGQLRSAALIEYRKETLESKGRATLLLQDYFLLLGSFNLLTEKIREEFNDPHFSENAELIAASLFSTALRAPLFYQNPTTYLFSYLRVVDEIDQLANKTIIKKNLFEQIVKCYSNFFPETQANDINLYVYFSTITPLFESAAESRLIYKPRWHVYEYLARTKVTPLTYISAIHCLGALLSLPEFKRKHPREYRTGYNTILFLSNNGRFSAAAKETLKEVDRSQSQ